MTGVTVIVTVAVLLVLLSSSEILNVKESDVPSPPEWTYVNEPFDSIVKVPDVGEPTTAKDKSELELSESVPVKVPFDVAPSLIVNAWSLATGEAVCE